MLSYPNAKINLGLYVVEKRTDGFHNIETVFYPVKGLCDMLEVLPSKSAQTTLVNTGLVVDAPTVSNICVKAWELLYQNFRIPAVDIYLHKQIPFGAGLGGGSSDAAHCLQMLNQLFKLGLSTDTLKTYALILGSDCAFFIENKPMLATGRGEVLQEVEVNLSGYHIVVVKPTVAVSTAQAYAGITPRKPDFSLAQLSGLPIQQWKQYLCNDFEESIFPKYPIIADIKEQLYSCGASYASMSGSGSSVFGIFATKPIVENLFPSCFVFSGELD